MRQPEAQYSDLERATLLGLARESIEYGLRSAARYRYN